MSAVILRGDARHLPLPNESVDLIVTSPPYFGLRAYTDGGEQYDGQIGAETTPAEYVAALLDCTREWMRVLKPTGSIFVNLGDKYSTYEGPRNVPQNNAIGLKQGAVSQEGKRYTRSAPTAYGIPYKSLFGLPWRYALGCIDDLGLTLRAELVWQKSNGMPESCTDRVRRSHETWFHFVKQQRYFSAVDEIREEHTAPTRTPGANAMGGRNINLVRTGTGAYEGPNPLGKVPGSVWEIATQPLNVPSHLDVKHYAAFPTEWPRRIIAGWAPENGVVVDPFGGTGTTALVADVLGRRGISIDRSADYCRLARWRTSDPGERARVLGLPKPPKQMDGQTDLFDDLGGAA